MLLSIGMIVKNEEKYLSRCLTALLPILKQVQSELIIADTGSTDSTVEIAREFTDKVFHFEWCDDFAKARNSTMEKARGEWYMQIDADEIIEDPKELIDFFNSGEYKQFNAATYIIRSSNDLEFKNFADMLSVRLIKLRSDSYYVGPIHEKFGAAYVPAKHFSVIAKHFGYITENNGKYIQFKMERNLKSLLLELEKRPDDFMLYYYISNAYEMAKEYEKALEYSEKGLQYGDEVGKCLLYCNLVRIQFICGNNQKAVEIADEYFKSQKNQFATDMEIYIIKGMSCWNLKRNQEALQTYKEYLHFFEQFKQGLHHTEDMLKHSISYADDASYRKTVLNVTRSLLKENDFEGAESYLHSVAERDYLKDRNNVFYWLNCEVGLMERRKNFSGIVGLYERLDDFAKETIQKIIELVYRNEDCRGLILSDFAALKHPKSVYSKLMKLRSDFFAGSLAAEQVQSFIAGFEEWTPVFADAAYFAIKAGLPFQSVTEKIDAYDVSAFFFRNEFYHFEDLPCLAVQICRDKDLDANSQLWLSFLYFMELTSDRLRKESVLDLFTAYANASFSSLKVLFQNELLTEENAGLLPRPFRIGFYCHLAADARKTNDNAKYLRHLRTVLKLCPQLKKAIDTLADRMKNELDKAVEQKNQFETYAAQVKESIRNLIAAGKINEATEFIKAYEKLRPADPDIENLKNQF
jgi:Glycosyltransferases involved in cell wall biogenesis